MTPGRLDLEVPRNGSDARTIQLITQDEDGTEIPLDISDCLITAQARDIFGGAVIATATVSIADAAAGKFNMTWLGSSFDGFGNLQQSATAAYDVKLVDGSGQPSVPARGLLHITPEATA